MKTTKTQRAQRAEIFFVSILIILGFAQAVANAQNVGALTGSQLSGKSDGNTARSYVLTKTRQGQGGINKNISGPVSLTLHQAIDLAIENNLSSLLAREQREEARGRLLETLSSLLPNILGTASQQKLTRNLAAEGIPTLPGRSSFIGPFDRFDARFQFSQTLFDLSAVRHFQAGRSEVKISDFQEQLVVEQLATATSLAYLNSVRADKAVDAAQANLELAHTLLKLARDQHDAGFATGVDVVRAETRVAEEEVRVAQTQTAAIQAKIEFQRLLGIPFDNLTTLVDPLQFNQELPPSIDAALALADQNRVELKIADEQVRFNNYQKQAAQAEQMPSIGFVTDYGLIGNKPNEFARPTLNYGVRLSLSIFNGGLTRGRVAVASSRKRQAELQLNDLKAQVEEDVRLALRILQTAAEQVRAAEKSLLLAQRELQLVRDRFSSGLGDNIEVINAQTALANARDAQIGALAQYNTARINLAAAMGRAQAFNW